MVMACRGSLVASALCGTAAANTQVGGCCLRNTLEWDNHGVQEAFECVDLIRAQVLVDIIERSKHHDKEQELEQQGQVASPDRCFE